MFAVVQILSRNLVQLRRTDRPADESPNVKDAQASDHAALLSLSLSVAYLIPFHRETRLENERDFYDLSFRSPHSGGRLVGDAERRSRRPAEKGPAGVPRVC